MYFDLKNNRTIWMSHDNPKAILTIDQRFLPFEKKVFKIISFSDAVFAINNMVVRGAPLIGATAAYGMYLSIKEAVEKQSGQEAIIRDSLTLLSSRPTAIDLKKGIEYVLNVIKNNNLNHHIVSMALDAANRYADCSARQCMEIGEYGFEIIQSIYRKKKKRINILTHCNAGKLATVDYGTALSPVYLANIKNIPVHIWVDETRPRNQGAFLTAFELDENHIPHTVIADNTGGHLMQHSQVDMVLVGADRITRIGDTANKIGTYLKALAANDNHVPFYVAAPMSTFDFSINNGLTEIPIEQRDAVEVQKIKGLCCDKIVDIKLINENTSVANYSFDVTPARLITAFITNLGVFKANKKDLSILFNNKTDF